MGKAVGARSVFFHPHTSHRPHPRVPIPPPPLSWLRIHAARLGSIEVSQTGMPRRRWIIDILKTTTAHVPMECLVCLSCVCTCAYARA